jgi:hypothetical protein
MSSFYTCCALNQEEWLVHARHACDASITIHVRRPIGANLDTFRAAVIDVKIGERKNKKEERKKRRERKLPL